MRIRTTLRDALSDPRLLGHALPGDTWLTWRAVLLAAMGEPLTEAELEAFRAVTGRENPPTERCDELVAIVGRRGGKSRATAVLATYLATLVDYSDVLVKGERGLLLTVAPDLRQAGIVRDYIAGVLSESEILRRLVDGVTRTTIRLTNGIDIESRPSNFRRLRGVTAIAAVCDESCFFYTDDASSNPDTAILDAIRPSLATTRGLLALISTPYARRGATWEAYSRHYGQQGDPAILVAHGGSTTFNPSLDRRVVDRAYERDPIAAAAEYGGQWRSDIAAFVSRDSVMACIDHGVAERPYSPRYRYHAHVDPSGGSNDSFTLAISHREGDLAVLDLVREVRPPFSPEGVVAEFCADLARYRIKRITGDRYAGEWPREQFRRRGIRYELADRPASDLFLGLLPMLNSRTARLLDCSRLIDQLCALERRTSFGGRDSIGHGPHGHDDLAVAVAGSLLAATTKKHDLIIGYGLGKITWRHEIDQTRFAHRIRRVTVSESDLEREGIRLA